ncbi:MAG: phasin family protein [Gemmatimonadaceae bacterium]
MPKTLAKTSQFPMLRGPAYQIWLAGLGAVSMAEDESGKMFKTLVSRGKAFQTAGKDRLIEVKERFDVRKAASNTVDRISENLDEGMNGVLSRLGLPTKKEIEGLSKRVERLTKTLEEKPVKTRARRAPSKRRAHATA